MDSVKAFFGDAVVVDGYIWIFDNLIQAMCKINVDSFEMEIVSFYKSRENFYARKIFWLEDKFYLVEQMSARILIFDRKQQGENSEFYLYKMSVSDNSDIYGIFLYGNCIWFFPEHIDRKVICFDICTEVYYEKVFIESFMKRKIECANLVSRHFSCYEGNVWFALEGTRLYLRYDMQEEKMEIFETAEKNAALAGCCFDGKEVWLADSNNRNIICEGKKSFQISEEKVYSRFRVMNGGIFAFTENSDTFIFIEKKNLCISVIKLDLKEKRSKYMPIGCCEYGDLVFLYLRHMQSAYVFNSKTLEVTCGKLKCADYLKKSIGVRGIVFNEGEHISLEQLVCACGQDTSLKNIWNEESISMGKTIWNTV